MGEERKNAPAADSGARSEDSHTGDVMQSPAYKDHNIENSQSQPNDGNGKRRRRAAIRAELDSKTPEELEELARIHGDTDGSYRIATWLGGKRELADEEVEKLLPSLPLKFYERNRKQIAKKYGIRTNALDKIRDPRSGGSGEGQEQQQQGTAITLENPEPWPDSVDGDILLKDIVALYEKYIVLPERAADAMALWVAFSHLHDNFDVSPIECFTSPQKRCAKTTALTLTGHLVPRALPATNLTPATVFRTIEQFCPTMIIDEAETFFHHGGNQRSVSEELRGVLNSGHLRSQAWVPRCVEPNHEVRLFSTWAPKAIALIGRLPSTLHDRSIIIKLERKRPDEKVERLRLYRLPQETLELQR